MAAFCHLSWLAWARRHMPSGEFAAHEWWFVATSVLWLLVLGAVTLFLIRNRRKHRQSEEALRREKDFAESLIEAAPVIVAVIDPQGRVVRCNPFAEKITGYPVEAIVGRNAFELFIPEAQRAAFRQQFQDQYTGAATSRDVNAEATVLVARDGRRREIQWHSRALRDDAGEFVGLLTIGRDVTDLRLAQEQALQAERLAAIGQTVAGLAHESGNALQRSQACLEMLAWEVKDRPSAVDLLSRIQAAQDHLHYLYDEVRRYAAPIVLRRQRVKLEDVLHKAWDHLEPVRAGRNSELASHNGLAGGPCSVDPQAMEQVFRNVLDNALAACEDSARVDVRWEPAELAGRKAVRVVLGDNGPGLSEEQRDRIFEPFYTTKTQGTGLGMAISRRIVEAHGGRIDLGPPADGGAEVVITLPVE